MRIAVASALLACALGASAARAQGRDPKMADQLFREARALMKKGDYEAACPKLDESYRLDPAPGTGVNLGDCFEKQGKTGSALLAYQAARALLSADDSRVMPVTQHIQSLKVRVPHLTIKLSPGAPDGTKVRRDGRVVEDVGVPTVVNPGKHTIVVTAPRREHRTYYSELDEGETRELVVDVGGPADAEEPVPSRSTPQHDPARELARGARSNDDSSQRTLGFVVGGVGAVSMVVGTLFLIEFEQEKTKNDQPDYNQSKVSNYGHLALGLPVGAVLVGAGFALVATAPADRASARRTLHVAPIVGTAGAGLEVGGSL